MHPYTQSQQLARGWPPGLKRSIWVLILPVVMLAGCASNSLGGNPSGAQPLPAGSAAGQGPITDSLVERGLDLHAGPVAVPLVLEIPKLGVSAPMLGVGLNAENVMDSPKGAADDPVWQKAFWYRGSGIPGDSGTATMSGHVDDVLGRPAVFARLKDLRPGDLIVVRDTRSGLDVRFAVARAETYTVQQAADPSVLAQVYGSGPVAGQGPQPAPDGRSHLTLITCSGDFVNGAYDSRLVVYAERSG